VTVVRGKVSRSELRQMVEQHDQVIMLGHGTAYGLLAVGQFYASWNVIDGSFSDLLAEKNNSIFIWCNANQFAQLHELKGFYTGMFISELHEAIMCGVTQATQNNVDESNDAFVKALEEVINSPTEQLYTAVNKQYGKLVATNPVAAYNHQRLGVA